MKPLVTIHDVSKSYGKVQALQHVSLEVMPGEIFGIIGPDGSGKTSLFRMLTTLLYPDEGAITVNGFDTVRITRLSAAVWAICRGDSPFIPICRWKRIWSFCHSFRNNSSRELSADRSYLQADRAFQETESRKTFGGNEAEAGSELCVDS